ncbi:MULTISPECIES: helix-turn-helix domain-containing protein [Sphingobacterium]|uniref:helix-turn-helix domain-containing protein n=1 Tax=Sphingobacterium TaxID=28453 RepID=UPI001C30BD30|nr:MULTISPECIES: helix-turn-helix domain-containing protein [Sphingobacterium]
MMTEIKSDYPLKYEVLRNYLYILIHEALKLSPPQNYTKPLGAPQRTTALFFELLERQFPVSNHHIILKLKTARDYADALSVNQDYLNQILKTNTGKTTTQHITLRIIKEAYRLLQNQDWSINEIAFALGFEEPSYLSNFFRKNTNVTPSSVRKSAL